MINKRLLIKNLLLHSDESSFYDKKRQLNLHTKEGKGKFLKHICALSNSNPTNNAYIIVGVEDKDNAILGDDFFDDSRIQNLVNAFIENPPSIQYDNVPFPHLKDKVVGLVTIKPNAKLSYFKKGIYTISEGSTFIRRGSNSIPVEKKLAALPVAANNRNTETIQSIENASRNSIAHTLDGVLDFINRRHPNIHSTYHVFKELFVICWAGNPKQLRDLNILSRVDIELINEQVKLFYSALDAVTINYDEDSFTIMEYVPLGLNDKTSYYPLERRRILFSDYGSYKIEEEFLFQPPEFNKRMLHHVYNSNLALLSVLDSGQTPTERMLRELENLPSTLMICHLNGFPEAKQHLIDAKLLLKPYANVYLSFKEALRILRKMKYA